jgi:hypothetical protein
VQLPLPEGETSRLESLTDLRILDTSPEQVFADVARLAALNCDTPIAVIDFVDEQRVWFKAKIGLELDDIPRDRSFAAHTILQSDVLIVPDLYSSNELVTIPVTVGLTNPGSRLPVRNYQSLRFGKSSENSCVQWIRESIGRLARSLLGAHFKRTKDCSPK